MSKDVKVLKLVNGEEVITRLEESDDGFLILEEPRVVDGIQVPEILLGGNHEKIKSWRKSMSEDVTKAKRPDLWKKYNKSIKQLEINHE